MTTTRSFKFQIIIPRDVRKKLYLAPHQKFMAIEKGKVITLIPEIKLKSLKGFIRGLTTVNIREKRDRL